MTRTRAVRAPSLAWVVYLEQCVGETGKQFTMVLFPYVFVRLMHVSAGEYSMVSVSAGVVGIVGSLVSALLVKSMGIRRLSVGGSVLSGGMILLAAVALLAGSPGEALVIVPYMGFMLASATYSGGVVNAVRRVAGTDEQFRLVNGRRSLAQASAAILMPSVAGLLIDRLGVAQLLFVDCLSWILSAGVFYVILTGDGTQAPPGGGSDLRDGNYKNRAVGGSSFSVRTAVSRFRRLGSHLAPDVVAGVVLQTSLTFARRFAMTLFPVFVLVEADAANGQFGYVYSAGGGGYVLGALLCSIPFRSRSGAVSGRVVLPCLWLLSGLSLIASVLAKPSVIVCCGVFAFASAAFGLMIGIEIVTLRQRALGDAGLAQVTGVADALETGAALAGGALAGVVATLFSLGAVMFVAGLLYLVSLLAVVVGAISGRGPVREMVFGK